MATWVKLTILPDGTSLNKADVVAFVNLDLVHRIDSDASGSMLWLTTDGRAVLRVKDTAQQIFDMAKQSPALEPT